MAILQWKYSKIQLILLIAVIVMWIAILIIETCIKEPSHIHLKGARVIKGKLPVEYRINLFDRRKPTVILMYSKDEGEDWMEEVTTLDYKYFQRMNCPIFSCVVTTNRSYLPSIDDFDVIVFPHKNLHNQAVKLPGKRSPKQIYILHILKPSPNDCLSVQFSNFFNMTMSYRFDGDILDTNGRVLSKETNVEVAPSYNPKWHKIPDRLRNRRREIFNKGKARLAAWIMKDCPGAGNAPPNTLHRIRQLQDFFPIDIFGPCADNYCASDEDCLKLIERDYKFLVQIQDSFSYYYVPSDTFYLMRFNIVPIFLSRVDFDMFLPHRSFLSSRNFKSLEELAAVVLFLGSHLAEYNMYFWWRDFYYIQAYPNYCDICEKTRKFRFSNKTQYYTDVNDWLSHEN